MSAPVGMYVALVPIGVLPQLRPFSSQRSHA